MARKKKEDPVAEIFGSFFIIVIIGIYLLTKSWPLSVSAGIVYFIIAMIILAIFAKARKEKLRASGIAEIDKMSGVQFEQYLALLFQDLNYTVKTTPATGDFGADLILQKDNRKIVVQAKRYSKNVGIKAVQEVKSAIDHYKANEAWVVTNSFFTKAAVELSQSNSVSLVNREQLIKLILTIKKTKQ